MITELLLIIAYYPTIKNIRKIFRRVAYFICTRFKKGKSLKDHLVRSVLAKTDVADNSGLCGGESYTSESSILMEKDNPEKSCQIHEPLNCNSKNTVYLTECNSCWKQYTGSPKTNFRYSINNHKSTHREFKNKQQIPKEALKQKVFHDYFRSDDHNGMQD